MLINAHKLSHGKCHVPQDHTPEMLITRSCCISSLYVLSSTTERKGQTFILPIILSFLIILPVEVTVTSYRVAFLFLYDVIRLRSICMRDRSLYLFRSILATTGSQCSTPRVLQSRSIAVDGSKYLITDINKKSSVFFLLMLSTITFNILGCVS